MARVILRDGHVAELRKAQNTPEDNGRIREFLATVSDKNAFFRFFEIEDELDDSDIEQMIGDGGENALTLMCTDSHRALAIGAYQRRPFDTAEVTFLVSDDVQKRGLGSLLLEHLAEAAHLNGIKQFEAVVSSDNERMMHVFRASGLAMTSNEESGELHVFWPLRHNERSRSLQETRERLATSASLHGFFHPRTVAVIGASRNPERLGHVVFRHILSSEFRGTVYPVNPTAPSVSAVKAYPNIGAIPEQVDLAVVVVSASQILSVIDDCIEHGVRSVMILSSGFSDTDPPGTELERELLSRLRGAGCRMIGPSSLGIIQMNPSHQFNASFAPVLPEYGSVAIASHSGALGITILDYAARLGVGVSSFVSLGNRADVSGNDLLQYWESDPSVELIFLYLESFGNPRKFTRITRRITRNKPILAVKSARTPVSVNVAQSRTVAVAAEDATVEAMFRQTGIIRVDTLQEMFDVAMLLRAGACRAGKRVAIVTNTSGGAIMAVDRLLREGLEFVPPVINLGFEALAESYRVVLPQVLRDDSVDAVVVLFTPAGKSDEEAVRVAISAALCEVANDLPVEGKVHPYEKPVVANFLTTGDYRVRYLEVDPERSIPIYPFPEQAVRALARVSAYHEYRDRDPGFIPDLHNIDTEKAREEIRAGLHHVGESYAVSEASMMRVLLFIGAPVELEHSVPKGIDVDVKIDSDPLFGPLLKLNILSQSKVENRPSNDIVSIPALRLIPLTEADARDLWQDALARVSPLSVDTTGTPIQELLLRLSQWVEDVPEITNARLGLRIADGKVYFRDANVFAALIQA